MKISVTRQSNLYKYTRKVVPIYSRNTFPKRELLIDSSAKLLAARQKLNMGTQEQLDTSQVRNK